MRFCPNCGNPLGGSPRYCAGCATQVDPEDDPTYAPPAQASPAGPLPLPTPVPAWSFHDPAWAARHPSREPDGSPWPASAPPWADSYPPWAAGGHPAAGDQAPAVITMNPGASLPAIPAATPEAARPDGRLRLSADRRPGLSPGHGTTITAMVTTVALLATGSVAAWQVGQLRSRLPATSTSLDTRRAAPDRPARTPGTRRSGPGPSPARAASSPAAGPAAATGAVTVTPAAASQPHLHRVVTLLDNYFSAINRHDFPAYSRLFIPAIRVGMHNLAAYQSTRDSRARLTGLSATGPQGLAVMVTFVSHQNPADSPDHAACDRWHVTVFLKRAGRSYHIRRHQPGFPADTVRACR